jgi:ABC-type multidrug transport system ATPase subunit
MIQIELNHIEKKYNEELLFSDINHTFSSPCIIALLGINGSGKSTLLQILAGYLSPSKGTIQYTINQQKISPDDIYQYVSVCAPYLELIEEMTLSEFLSYHASFKPQKMEVNEIIAYIGLEKSKDKLIEKYSSGMKQRVKLAQAFISNAPVLLLDEPCTNLDEEGIKLYEKMIQDFTKDKIVIIASNDPQETKHCTEKYYIRDFK